MAQLLSCARDGLTSINIRLERPTFLAGNKAMMLCRVMLVCVLLLGGEISVAATGRIDFETGVKPLFNRYCDSCHGEKKKGDLDLRIYADELSAKKDAAEFEKILDKIQNGEMPPENKPQPSAAQRKLITGWIEAAVLGCDCDHPDPGRVTIRRLNRSEYNRTIRDLVGVDFQPADDFPADDVGYGFDNIGDVLSLSPMLMEKYMAAAGKIMDMAIDDAPATNGPATRFAAADMQCTAEGGKYGESGRELSTEGEVYTKFLFPKSGEYIFRVRACAQQAGPDPARMELRVDGHGVKVLDVTGDEEHPKTYEVRAQNTAGEKRVSAAFINDYYQPADPDPDNRDRNLIIKYVEIVGPIEPKPVMESYRRIFIRQPTPQTDNETTREIIGHFAMRAYRRRVRDEEVKRLFEFFQMVRKDGGTFEAGIKLALQAVLVSPNFLFRGEAQPEPGNPQAIHPIDEYALATRLSYFLWSSMPDEELFAQAANGTLRKNLKSEVGRMLKDPKAHALVENFADQWLQIRNLATMTPDKETFPEFDEDLRSAMGGETERFFDYIMQENRSILEFVDADYTFLNERLARHYGITGVKGNGFRRVSLRGTGRGGLLTQASILTITSTPTRTSPVKRGKWVLENMLGAPPPPPLPNVPVLKEGKEAKISGTMRQRMEQHRADPNCATCHARMDPIGFGLENYDGVGAWRTQEGQFAIDASGKLFSGESFDGANGLKAILLKGKRQQFARCLAEKMLTYALGRGLEHYDKCALDNITKELARNGYRFDSLVEGIVESVPFEEARGEK
jgi:hypothetical protein